MELIRFESGSEFYRRAGPFLLEREAEHNLILGITAAIAEGSEWVEPQPYLALVQDAGAPVAVAVMTPPHNLILSHTDEAAALEPIAADLLDSGTEVPGVTGPADLARAFAELWRRRTGRAFSTVMSQRIFKLETVRPPEGVPGRLRRAADPDRPLLRQWIATFHQEATGEGGPPTDEALDRWLRFESRGMYLWEDGEPVSMAGHTGPTLNGIRIGAVYTPPEKRRRGYAGACVAGLSQLMLDSGRRFCFLYTDLANPTSNHIYQEIGYQPVADSVMYRFAH